MSTTGSGPQPKAGRSAIAAQDSGGRLCATCGALAGQPGRFCSMCGAVLANSGRQTSLRRHVVVLFADLAGSTAMSQRLDPEVLRSIMDRYFRLATEVVWRHGGTTEKFIGDAVMAVFGIPVVREDDAIRAVRAASDLVTGVEQLNADLTDQYRVTLAVRVAVHSGLVSTSYDAAGDFRVVGDAVNTASRLESAAQPGQILVGETVAQLVRSRAQLAEVGPLSLKGLDAPVRAWRLVSLSAPAESVPRAPFIDREVEQLQLRQLFEGTVLQGRGAMATLLGPPGIGKSRLAAQFESSLDPQAFTVLRGQATSYGRGASYQPIQEMLESAPGAWAALASKAVDDAAAARSYSCLAGLLEDTGTGGSPASVEEIAEALLTFAATLADYRPLLLIWEDLHWAEPTMLDMIEFLGDELRDFPIMQLCTARPELLEQRPAWSGGRVAAVNLQLAPLSADDMLTLTSHLRQRGEVVAQSDEELCALVTSASEGNPLLAELMLDVAGDDAVGAMPQSIQALFAARLDQLEHDDRLVLEMAAVAGRSFLVADVAHLLATDSRSDLDLTGALDRLRRTRLVTGNRLSTRYSFSQSFARDTAYELTAKRNRLRWHLALADRDQSADPDSSPASERSSSVDLLPYHLEAALALTRELHPNSPSVAQLGTRAAAALAAQATAAMSRTDLRAAAALFERALGAISADDPGRVSLVIQLSDTWLGMGCWERAIAALNQHVKAAEPPVEIEVQRELIDLRRGRRKPAEIVEAEQRLQPRLGADDLARCHFHQLRAYRHLMCEQLGAADASLTVALKHALAAGDHYQQGNIIRDACQLMMWGPNSVADGLERCRELAVAFAEHRPSLVVILATTGGLLALDGDDARAREKLTVATTYAADVRMRRAEVGLAHLWGVVESLAGAHRAAADHFRRARSMLDNAGNRAGAALLDAYAARELVASGDPVPAPYLELNDDDVAALTDPRTGALAASLCARGAVERAEPDRAAALVERAGALASGTDDLYFRGTIHCDIALILILAGRHEEARAATEVARRSFHAKGARAALLGVDRLTSRLTQGSG